MNITFLVVFLIAAVNFPVSQLPVWLQPLAYLVPFTHGIEAAREVIGGASLTAV